MLEVIPAILTNDPKELEEKISRLEGLVKRVQVDVVDGVFAQNRSIGLEALTNIDTSLLIDVHLMTKDPIDWIEKSVRAMADRIIGQVEMMSDQFVFASKVQELGHQAGLAIDLDTPVSSIDPTVLINLDVILVMSVKAGFGGQAFEKSAIRKIKDLDELRAKEATPFRICVDGGINISNIKYIKEAGADEVAIGHLLFEGDLEENIAKLENRKQKIENRKNKQ